MKSGTIKVDYLARVEGEGALYIKVKGGAVEDVRLKIFEPPRFFEAFLRGRHYSEAPDITSRICGICPIAYQMSAVAYCPTTNLITPSFIYFPASD
jgi:coenzyme F420-reducing hydrogenase alpha subunit